MIQLAEVAVPVAADVIAAFALSLTPMWVRPGTYFGVRVSPEYRSTPEARRSRRSFRLKVWGATVPAVALSMLGSPWLVALGFLIQLGAASVAFRAGWRETSPHRIAPPSTRTAHLLAPPPRVPGGPAAVIAPFLLLAGVSLYLLANWDSIPARFPIHWNHGQANGWSERTIKGVFGPVLLAFAILVVNAGVIALHTRMARRGPAGSGLHRRNRAMLAVSLIVMWQIAIMFSLAALMPVIVRDGHFPIPGFIMMLIPVAGIVASIWLVVRASAEPDDTPADNTPDECWKWGQFYSNPADPSILVEKRFGLGYTLNFARWQSRVVLAGILASPVVVFVLIRLVIRN